METRFWPNILKLPSNLTIFLSIRHSFSFSFFLLSHSQILKMAPNKYIRDWIQALSHTEQNNFLVLMQKYVLTVFATYTTRWTYLITNHTLSLFLSFSLSLFLSFSLSLFLSFSLSNFSLSLFLSFSLSLSI